MMKKRKTVLCSIALMLFVYNVSAKAEADGGQAGSFLRYGVGARAMGMGRAFVAFSDDASAIYWNPAGMLGAKRNELTSLYSNLYYDSRYAYMGFIMPRPSRHISNKLGRFLFGPSASFGFGWIGLSMSGFEQRTSTGLHLGNFGISEDAFLASWAREEVGSWGIFRWGLTYKLVSQNFPGLMDNDAMSLAAHDRNWSSGLDAGFIFKPIHAPLFRVVSLRYLLPLQIGFSCHNLIQPGWYRDQGEKDPFPRVIRWGVGYRWILKDWIPYSWEYIQSIVGSSSILTVVDKEYMANTSSSTYFGVEGRFLLFDRFHLFPRYGINSHTEGPSYGLGLAFPFSSSAVMKLDYTYGTHDYLIDDNRFSLTVQMGHEKGAEYFTNLSDRVDISEKDMKNYLLRVIAEYPNSYINEAVGKLVKLEDSVYVRRYYSLTGGLGHATWLMQDARDLLKEGNVDKAKKKAMKAVEEYLPVFVQPEHTLNDNDLINFGEALIITSQLEDAVTVLEEIQEPNLKSYYLLGTCHKSLENPDDAIKAFGNAVKRYEQEQDLNSMVTLSLIGLGETLMKKQQYQNAYTTLQSLLKGYPGRLDADYPRYPIFKDNYVIDDAQFLLGLINSRMQRYPEGITDLMTTQKFFPELDLGKTVENKADRIVQILEEKNWSAMEDLILQLSDLYDRSHQLP